ncbi:MAG: BadF/BadG/BcrA/BcrD ATPase family protein, partial [Verrucomicrobiota bacterium]
MTDPVYIGIEGGGTHTVAIAATADGKLLSRSEFGPGNIRLLSDKALHALFAEIASSLPNPGAIGIGMAGAREQADFNRIDQAITHAWGAVPRRITNDLETALATLPDDKPKVLVLSGTGSCCFGQTTDGRTVKVGGWGHILGDKGSGYEIGLRSLKAVVCYLDRDGKWSPLGQRILRALMLNEPNDLIAFAQGAQKDEVAALAIEVFAAADQGDRIARDILDGAAALLAKDALACAKRLRVKGTVRFLLAGSVLTRQKQFARKVASQIKAGFPKAEVQTLSKEAVWGAVKLAQDSALGAQSSSSRKAKANARKPAIYLPQFDPTSAPTEMRNPRSR